MSENHPTEDQMPQEVPGGKWVKVPKGMTMAPGVIPHPDQGRYPGILVMENDHTSVVRWHNKGCNRTGKIDPDDIKFDMNGAPWCPTCFAENLHRDPDWNSPKDQSTTLTPTPQNVADETRPSRKALRDGKFRDPALDPKVEAIEEVAHELNPPGGERVGDLSALLGTPEQRKAAQDKAREEAD